MLEIEKIRERLLAERRALVTKVAEVDDNLRWLDANAEAYEAQAQAENIVRALGGRLDDKGRTRLDAIGRALVRMAAGEYGRCTTCGSDIPHQHPEQSPTMEQCPPCTNGSPLSRQ
jgi:DnaK suppressor protein